MLSSATDYYFEPFRHEMRRLGYIEGESVVIEARNAEGRLDRIAGLVRELVTRGVNVLVLPSNVAVNAAQAEAAAVPSVFMSSVDPVAAGYVKSLAHPGGNMTGIAVLQRDLGAKRIELMRDIFPALSRLSILWDADGPGPKVAFETYENAARALGLQVESLRLRGPKPDVAGAFATARAADPKVMIVVANPLTQQFRMTIMALATKNRFAVMVENEAWTNNGELIGYGTSIAEITMRVAALVNQILKGANPADLPVEQPTKFALVINMKTARALRIKIPHAVLTRADQVIE